MCDAFSSSQEPSLDSSLTEVLKKYREDFQQKRDALKGAIDGLKTNSTLSGEDLESIQECVLRDHTIEVLLARQWAEVSQNKLSDGFSAHIFTTSKLKSFVEQKTFKPFWDAMSRVFQGTETGKHPEPLQPIKQDLFQKIQDDYRKYQKFCSLKKVSGKYLPLMKSCYDAWEKTDASIQTLTQMTFNSHTTFPKCSSTPSDKSDRWVGMGTGEAAPATPIRTPRRPGRRVSSASTHPSDSLGSSPIYLGDEERYKAQIAELSAEKYKLLEEYQRNLEQLKLQFQSEQDALRKTIDANEAEIEALRITIKSLERDVCHEQRKNNQYEREHAISNSELAKAIEESQKSVEKSETKVSKLREERSRLVALLQDRESEIRELVAKNDEHNQKIEALVRFLENKDNGFSVDDMIDEGEDSYERYLRLLPKLQASLSEKQRIILANQRLQEQLLNIREEDAIEPESGSTDNNEFRYREDNELPDSILQALEGQSIQELYSNIEELCNECHNFFKHYSLYRKEIKTQIQQIKSDQADCERVLQSCHAETPDSLEAVRVQLRVMAERPLSQPITRLTGDAEESHKNPSRLSAFFKGNKYNSLGNEKFERELQEQTESLSGTLGYISTAVTRIQNNLHDQASKYSNYFFQITLLQTEVYRVKGKLNHLEIYIEELQERFKEFERVEKLKVIKRWFEEILNHFPQLMLTLLRGLLKFLGPDDVNGYLSFIDEQNPSDREEDLLSKVNLLKEKTEIAHDEKSLQNVPDIAVPWGEVAIDARKARYQKLDFFQETLAPQAFEWDQNKLVIFQEKHHAEGKECATLEWYHPKIKRFDSESDEVILFLVQGIVSTIEKNPGMMITLNGEDAMVRQLANYLYAVPMLYKALTIDTDLEFQLKVSQLDNLPDPTEELQKMCQKVLRGDPLGLFDTHALLLSC